VGSAANATKRFIFRQDDIEDYYHNTVQASMINWFIDNGVGVSVGIISNSFTGQDPIIYNALKRCVDQGMDKCAIWNHGTDAAYHFGEAASVQEAQKRIQTCDTKIKTYFPGYQPFLMAPHQNSWGPFLLQALRNLGYKVVSASTAVYSGMKWDLMANPMQMPQQANTGDWDDTKKDFVAVPISKTVADCEVAAARGEVCVIMIHPHEFANGAYSLTTLAQLVQSLKAAGFTSTNFYTVMNENAKTISKDGRCGVHFENTFCGNAETPCCSEYGWCGALADHCATGCQSGYGVCDDLASAASESSSIKAFTASVYFYFAVFICVFFNMY
jgi:hypothetical protein